jgi:membrane protease YdiL (CAAX protease family)
MIIGMETDTRAETPRDTDTFRAVASPWHTVVLLAVIMASVLWGKFHAEQMRAMANPDRIGNYKRIILSEWLTLALVLAGVWLRGSSLLLVMGDRWRTVRQFLRDVGIGLVFLVATIMFTSLTGSHGDAGDRATQFLLPQGRIEIAIWVVLSITAGICEEAIYRGYLQ